MTIEWRDAIRAFPELSKQLTKNPEFVVIGYDTCPYSMRSKFALEGSNRSFLLFFIPRSQRTEHVNQILGTSMGSPYHGTFPLVFQILRIRDIAISQSNNSNDMYHHIGGSDSLIDTLQESKQDTKIDLYQIVMNKFPVLNQNLHRDVWVIGSNENQMFQKITQLLTACHQSHPKFHATIITTDASDHALRNYIGFSEPSFDLPLVFVKVKSDHHFMLLESSSKQPLDSSLRHWLKKII